MHKVKAKRSVFNKKEDYFNRDYIEYKIHCIRGTVNDADCDKVVRIWDIYIWKVGFTQYWKSLISRLRGYAKYNCCE